jgi:hypothetical protein
MLKHLFPVILNISVLLVIFSTGNKKSLKYVVIYCMIIVKDYVLNIVGYEFMLSLFSYLFPSYLLFLLET